MAKIKANRRKHNRLKSAFESLEHRTLLSSYGTLNANWIDTGPYSPATFMEGETPHSSPKIGQFDWQRLTASDPSGYGPGTYAGQPNPGDSFAAFCIELTQNLHQNNVPFNYDVRDLSETPSPNIPMGAMGPEKADFLRELWGRYFNDIGNDPIKGAAFQLDVWETVYDTDHNISTGDFQIVVNNATDSAIAAQAQAWLSGVTGTGPKADLLTMSSPDYQDMVFESPKPHNAALGDYVWYDSNANGIQDTGEAGIPNVTVNLLDSLGNQIATTLTDGSGFYHFTDLTPGNYQLQFVAPDASYVLSPTGQGTIATDSDANPATGITSMITLGPDQVDNTWDAGMYQKSALGDFVWADVNANGIQDAGEAGIGGVTVNLLDGGGTQISTTTTDAGGYYHFTDLNPGNYEVEFVLPDGSYIFSPTGHGTSTTDSNADATSGRTGVITLAPGQTDNTWDAGMWQPGSISGHKYEDQTGNGMTADDLDHPLSGVTIQLFVDANHSGALDSGDGAAIASMQTDANGAYDFTGLLPGRYFVQEIVPTGYVRTGPALTSYYTVDATAGSTSTGNDFDNAEMCDKSVLSSYYFIINGTTHVTDLRGHIHSGDVVTAVFTVATFVDSHDISLVSYTAPEGTFVAAHASQQQVFDLDTGTFGPGVHTLTVTVPDCYFQIDFVCGQAIDHLGPAGSNIFYSAQSRLFSADNGGTRCCVMSPSSLSGFVYVDSDNDGIKDAGEAGIGGVLVTLNGPNGLVLTRTTAADGSYSFANLPAGTYKITETQPSPFLDGKDTIGSLGGITSNDMFSSIIVHSSQDGVNYNFGERTPCVRQGDFATIGFWHNRNGQALICGLNGSSSSTALGKWLATTFPNLYGPGCGAYSMVQSNGSYFTNSQVAASYLKNFFNVSGMKVNAQILASALGAYVTSTTLAGGNNAKPYGFNTSAGGTGSDGVNIGSDGAAFGVANNSTISVMQMLQYVNSKASHGVLYAGNSQQSSLISMANDAFDKKVNSAGDIA